MRQKQKIAMPGKATVTLATPSEIILENFGDGFCLIRFSTLQTSFVTFGLLSIPSERYILKVKRSYYRGRLAMFQKKLSSVLIVVALLFSSIGTAFAAPL